MEPLFIYLIKANLSLSLFYVFFGLFLRKETFHQSIRIYFLASFALSYLLPWLGSLPWIREQQVLQAGMNELTKNEVISWVFVQMQQQQNQMPSLGNLLGWMLLSGIAMSLIPLFLELRSLFLLRKESKAGFLENIPVRTIERNIAPFSFFREIFLNPALHTREDLARILAHERIHVAQWHTVDVVVSRIILIAGWFNPLCRMMQKDMIQNLEYLADRRTLEVGFNKKGYQYHLIATAVFSQPIPITNHFNHHFLKNRIKMMNKKDSPKLLLSKYLLVLPFLFASLLLTNANDLRNQTVKHLPESVQHATAQIRSAFLNPVSPAPSHAPENRPLKDPESEHSNEEADANTGPTPDSPESIQANPSQESESSQGHDPAISFKIEEQELAALKEKLDSFSKEFGEKMAKLFESEELKKEIAEEVNSEAFRKELSQLAQSIQMNEKLFKQLNSKEFQELVKTYGEQIKSIVSTIPVRREETTPHVGIETTPHVGIRIQSHGEKYEWNKDLASDDSPLFIVNGECLNGEKNVPESSFQKLSNIHPEQIQGIEVLKNEEATKQYPYPRAKNGVIRITTK